MNHLEIALGEYGIKEIAGDTHNPRVIQYSTDIGNTWVTTDEVHWCSEFVNWCLLKSGIQGTKSAVARSFLKWGEELQKPELGCIVVYKRPPEGSNNGHVNFYISETATHVWGLGGNQNDEVNIRLFPKEQILSYRKVPKLVSSGENNKIYEALIPLLTEIKELLNKKPY